VRCNVKVPARVEEEVTTKPTIIRETMLSQKSASGLPTAASLLPALSELVCDIGLSSRLVAVSHECDASPALARLPIVTQSKLMPRCTTSPCSSAAIPVSQECSSTMNCSEIAAGWRAVAARDSSLISAEATVAARLCSFYATDVSALASVQPTIVLTHVAQRRGPLEPCEEEVGAALNSVIAASGARCPVSILSLDASTVSEICAAAHGVARALGTPIAAHSAVRRMRVHVEKVRRSAAHRFLHPPLAFTPGSRSRPLVAVVQWADPLYVAGHWVPEVIEAAGGRDAFCRPGGPSVAINPCQLCDVDIIVIAVCAVAKQGAVAIATSFWATNASVLVSCKARVAIVDATRLFSRASLSCVADTCEVMHEIIVFSCDESASSLSPHWQVFHVPGQMVPALATARGQTQGRNDVATPF
jgi:iron complex transport system substrate-binding protein